MSGPKRQVLVATLGLAPQVLTETLYALAVRSAERFIPEEIHIVTTAPGRERAIYAFLDGPRPRLRELAADYNAPQIAEALTPERVHVILGADGAPLTDIDSERDNMAAADGILDLVRRLTADPDTALHVSIAGGRKTMGFLLGYALSLYGRPQDRLSHVLVDAPLETHPEFYYPRPAPEMLTDREGRSFLADASRVVLADIPFVRLRKQLPAWLLEGSVRYAEAVAATDERFRPPSLLIDLTGGALICQGQPVSKIGSAELAFAALLAQRRRDGAENAGALHHSEIDIEDFLDLYALTPAPLARTIAAVRERAEEPERFANWFSMRVTRLNRALQEALGPLADAYMLKRQGGRPKTRVGFVLPPEAIVIRGVPWLGSR